LQPRPGLVVGALGTMSPELLARLRSGWELVNNRWNQWVLNYSRVHQFELLQQLGVRSPQWQDLALLLAGLLASTGLAGAAWAWWDRRRQDPWQRLLARVRATLLRLQVPVQAHDPPRTLSRTTRATLGPVSASIAELLEDLDRLHYGPQALHRPPTRWWRTFARSCRQMKHLQR
ncbi:MAG TPA: DUF3488 domain-containing protein, partial [Burkholderiaceae bacterium]|nr:DUF3488 domain-containing protein [Burkholderiaceae bacterium]